MAVAEVFGRTGRGYLNREPIRKVYIELVCVGPADPVPVHSPFAAGFWASWPACQGHDRDRGGHLHPAFAEDDAFVGIQKMSSGGRSTLFFQSISAGRTPPGR